MNITRRDALMGATAAAVVTGATTAPLAIKAVAVKTSLAGDPVLPAFEAYEATRVPPEARSRCGGPGAGLSESFPQGRLAHGMWRRPNLCYLPRIQSGGKIWQSPNQLTDAARE